MVNSNANAAETCRKNLLKWLDRQGEIVEEWKKDIKQMQINDNYDVLKLTSYLLDQLLVMLPFGWEYNPFCIENCRDIYGSIELECNECQYAETHGTCSERASVYQTLTSAIWLLKGIIDNLYAAREFDFSTVSDIHSRTRDVLESLELLIVRRRTIKYGTGGF